MEKFLELMNGGHEPATKEDIRNLEATMLAGFELCSYLLNAILLGQANSKGEPPTYLIDLAREMALKNMESLTDIKARILQASAHHAD